MFKDFDIDKDIQRRVCDYFIPLYPIIFSKKYLSADDRTSFYISINKIFNGISSRLHFEDVLDEIINHIAEKFAIKAIEHSGKKEGELYF